MALCLSAACAPAEGEPVAGVDGAVHRFADHAGVRWHWIEAGEGDPLVLVHGMPETSYAWRHQIAAFASRYRVIAPDLKGFGLSSKRDGDYSMATVAAELAGLLEQIGVSRMRLVGHDWGGVIAARMASEYPERIVAYAHVAAPLDMLDLGRWPDYRDFRDDPSYVAGFLRSADVFVTRIFEATMVDLRAITPAELTRHIDEFGRSGVRQAVGYWFRDLDLDRAGQLGPRMRADWGRMRFPVDIVVGDRDLQAPLELYLPAAALIPGFRRLQVIDDAGHYPAEEQPGAFNTALEDLFDRE